GQHFSAIAAAGPIAGPIIACQAFGWLPYKNSAFFSRVRSG
ncbi:carbon starvation CstA family protein, partial [Ferruginibacter sp.]